MPADVKQTVEAAHVELVELLGVSGVHDSVLTVEWGGQLQSDFQLGGKG